MTYNSTSVNTEVENTVTFVSNQLMTAFIKIGNEAGADISPIARKREKLQDSIGAWLEEQTLSAIRLEIRTSDGEKLDGYRFEVSYDGDKAKFEEFDAPTVLREVDDYSWRSDVELRVIPMTYKSASDQGWVRSDAPNNETRSLNDFGAGHIEVDTQKIVSFEDQKPSDDDITDLLDELGSEISDLRERLGEISDEIE